MQTKSVFVQCPACKKQILVRAAQSYRAAIKSYQDHEVECSYCGTNFTARKDSLTLGVSELSPRPVKAYRPASGTRQISA